MRKIECPFLENAWVGFPDRWLGLHASRRDEALDQAREKKLGETLTRFAVSMALLDDWNLPGLAGNPEQWDYQRIDLALMSWVIGEVLPDFFLCLNAPAAYSKRSGNGQATSMETTTNPVGTSESAAG